MAFTCEICHQTMESAGAYRIHQMVGHDGPSPAAPACRPGAEAGLVAGTYARRPEPKASSPRAATAALTAAIALVLLAGVGTLGVRLGDKDSATQVAAAGEAGEDIADGNTEDDDASATIAPDGFKTIRKASAGFSIVVPEEFDEISWDESDAETSAELLDDDLPAIAEMLRSDGEIPGEVLYTMDPSSGRGALVQKMAEPGASFDDMPDGVFSELYRSLGATSVTEDWVELPVGKALQVHAALTAEGITMELFQFVLVDDGTVWALTYVSPERSDAGAEAVAVASSFAFED